ncbi:MAG: patatin, partial [Pseudomonadota bacterium]
AIPAAFPPVLIPVIAEDGRRYDEMHVDGGATQQVILYSPQFSSKALDEAVGVDVERSVYVVINNKLRKPYDPVRPRIYSIAGRAASSLIGGSGTGDIYRIFTVAQRDDIDFNVVAIPTSFDVEAEDLFDPVYMGALYDLGFDYGEAGDRWSPYPLDFVPFEDVQALTAAAQ